MLLKGVMNPAFYLALGFLEGTHAAAPTYGAGAPLHTAWTRHTGLLSKPLPLGCSLHHSLSSDSKAHCLHAGISLWTFHSPCFSISCLFATHSKDHAISPMTLTFVSLILVSGYQFVTLTLWRERCKQNLITPDWYRDRPTPFIINQ